MRLLRLPFQLLSRLFEALQPPHYVYLILHVILAVGGWMLIRFQSETWKAVGTSLIATAITGFIVFIYLRSADATAKRLEMLRYSGILAVFGMRAAAIRDQYVQRLKTARSHIDIMGFGLRALREDFLDEFPEWAKRAEVRLLLLDPSFPSARYSYGKQRDKEEGDHVGRTETDVKKFLQDVQSKFGGHLPDSFQIRLYRCLPSINIFRVDGVLFWGPYLIKKQSRNTPTMLCSDTGELFKVCITHFDSIWRDDELSVPALPPPATDG